MSNDEPKADYHGPRDPKDHGYQPHVDVHKAAEHLLNGRVTNSKARGVLRDALDKADVAGAKADKAGGLGRAITK